MMSFSQRSMKPSSANGRSPDRARSPTGCGTGAERTATATFWPDGVLPRPSSEAPLDRRKRARVTRCAASRGHIHALSGAFPEMTMDFETSKRIAILETQVEVLSERGRAKDVLITFLLALLRDHPDVALALSTKALQPTPTTAALRSGEVACPIN